MKKTKETRPLLSRNIQSRRKSLGLKQDDLAHRAGIGISTLKDIERGASSPSRETVEAVASVLESTVDELYGTLTKPTPTVSNLLQALTEMKNELDKLSANPLVILSEKLTPEQIQRAAALLEGVLDQASDKSDKTSRHKAR